MPMINYKSGLGFGALTRFSSATNNTMAGYGSAADKVVIYGKQDLDDNLYMQYGVNSYQNEWFSRGQAPLSGSSGYDIPPEAPSAHLHSAADTS